MGFNCAFVLCLHLQVYLAITVFVWALAIVFYFSRIPEISDDDMQYQQEVTPGILRHDQKPLIRQYRLFLAVWGQFMYVGAEGVIISVSRS